MSNSNSSLNKMLKQNSKKLLPYKINYKVFFARKVAVSECSHVNEDQKCECEKKKKKKSKLLSVLFLIFNIVIVVGIFLWQFLSGDVKPIQELFAESPYYRFLFLALGIQCLYLVVEAVKFTQLIYRSTKRFMPIVAFKTASIGRYWDCITPFGSGGQPFQIMYLRKNGCSGDVATGTVFGKHIFWQIAYITIGIIVLILPFNLYTGGNVVKYVALAGLLINFLLLLLVVLVSINRKVGYKLIVGGLKLFAKMKIVKNYDKALVKVVQFIESYQKCVRSFAKSPIQFVTQLIYAIANILLNATVAYCIYLAFNYPNNIAIGWPQIVSMALLCELATSIIPIPGGSGFAEISFVAMFSLLFKEGTVFWALLFWRIFTYYFFIIFGFIVTLIDAFTKKKRINKLVNQPDEFVYSKDDEIIK